MQTLVELEKAFVENCGGRFSQRQDLPETDLHEVNLIACHNILLSSITTQADCRYCEIRAPLLLSFSFCAGWVTRRNESQPELMLKGSVL